jgi:glycosyltransferase involved in cell wall biosynthesis
VSRLRRRPAPEAIDVLIVSLGGTIGLRNADDQLAASLRAAGQRVELIRVAPQREVRTLMLTDLIQALAARRAARDALRRVEPRAIVYSTTTSAMFWPRPGAIRFDALAQDTRPGRHGLWQRPLEARRLRQARLLIPWSEASLSGAAPEALARPRVTIPISISVREAPNEGAASATPPLLDELESTGHHAVAVTYAADPRKKGLDRLLAAWALVRQPNELLLVTGRDELPEGYGPSEAVQCTGKLSPQDFRALVRAVGVLAMAPRREDYGLVQLEALAEGARVATTAAPGPYAALSLVQQLWPEQVVPDADDPQRLGAALRHAIDARLSADDLLRATAATRPWRAAAVGEKVERELVPALRAT